MAVRVDQGQRLVKQIEHVDRDFVRAALVRPAQPVLRPLGEVAQRHVIGRRRPVGPERVAVAPAAPDVLDGTEHRCASAERSEQVVEADDGGDEARLPGEAGQPVEDGPWTAEVFRQATEQANGGPPAAYNAGYWTMASGTR